MIRDEQQLATQLADLAWVHAILSAGLVALGGSISPADGEHPDRNEIRIADRAYIVEVRPRWECPSCGANVPENVLHDERPTRRLVLDY